MRLGLLTLLWGRPVLSGIVLSYYDRLKIGGVELVGMAVVSEEDRWLPDHQQTLADLPMWASSYAPNRPLTEKFNDGMQAMSDMEVDAVMVIGSDDLISQSYFTATAEAIREGADYVTCRSLYFYDTRLMAAVYATCSTPIGAARTLSHRLLQSVGYRPWHPEPLMKSCDRLMDERLRSVMQTISATHVSLGEIKGKHCVLDIKSHGMKGESLNLWPYDLMCLTLKTERVNALALLGTYFPEEADALYQWNQTLDAYHQPDKNEIFYEYQT